MLDGRDEFFDVLMPAMDTVGYEVLEDEVLVIGEDGNTLTKKKGMVGTKNLHDGKKFLLIDRVILLSQRHFLGEECNG